ncbi:MAG: SMC family ATPase [Candidatus Thermoplasmatota archaeon]|nr:SMC family ATPase [Candidatus Thermoplasmatota archaeon]
MRISYLELKNYRRFKELKLQFPDGVVGVLGLNGAGKSTIMEAVAWALFGNVEEVVRTSREGVRRTGAAPSDTCAATLEFELGGTEYRIVREMGGKNLAMRAWLRTKDKVLAEGDKSVRTMVEKLIGMDHKSFFTSVFARQKELNALQSVAAGERKKVILRMLRIDSIDGVISDARADLRDAKARIEGAQKTLLAEDGREKEKILAEKLPELERVAERTKRELEKAESAEKRAGAEAEVARRRRDELRKDAEAYSAAASSLNATRAKATELRKREKSIASRLAEAKGKLGRLPELESTEEQFESTSKEKEELEREKERSERARQMTLEIASEEKDEARREKELEAARASIVGADDIASRIQETERMMSECQASRTELSGKVGELKARIRERKEAADKDRNKLEEIKAAGREGICPTCERTLDDAYELLVVKLSESAAAAGKAAGEAAAACDALESELKALAGKEEALKKRRANMDQKLMKLRKAETSYEEKKTELSRLRERLSERRKGLEEIGPIKFDGARYEKVRAEHERLRRLHEELIGLRMLAGRVQNDEKEMNDVRESIGLASGEEAQLQAMASRLEPRKEEYNTALKDFDLKMTAFGNAKDTVRKLSGQKDKAAADLGMAKTELGEIERTKKSIENDRRAAEELGLLVDVLVGFKDRLIGRVVPALSELTSKGLEAMTEGRYSRAELDESYELHIEDQGTMYPIDRFSGGESDLANLSLRLAISRMIAERTGAAPLNFLMLDEIFGSQDPNRKRSVMTALSRLSVQFRQIFLITHIEDIKDSTNYVIRVFEQEDGTSAAELAS